MLKNIMALVFSFLFLLKSYVKQKLFVRRYLLREVKMAYEENDGTLPDKNKLIFNYSILVPMVLGEAFCALRGYKMKKSERWESTLQSAFSVLADTIFDENLNTEMNIKSLFGDLNNVKGKNSCDRLFFRLYRNYCDTGVSEYFKEYLTKIYNAEVESCKQTDNINLNKLKEITRLKGGYSILFYRVAYENKLNNAEQDLLFALGECVQLANDTFDIYKDYNSGIKTLITECNNFSEFKTYYERRVKEIIELAYKLDTKKRNIKTFIQIVSLAVFSRTLVCLDYYEKMQLNSKSEYKIEQFSQKELMCDMEKPVNILKMFQYFLVLN